jgi:hypothetical protein
LTLFATPGRTIRVAIVQNISLDEADALVALLAAGKIRYTDEDSRKRAAGIDLSNPDSIGRGKNGTMRVMFSCGDDCILVLECVMEDDEIVVRRSGKMLRCY